MTTLFVVLTIICIVSAVVFLWQDQTWAWMVGAVAAFGAISFGCVSAVITIGPAHDSRACERAGVQLEREVRFVHYSSFSWDCITPSPDGWVSLDRVIKAEHD